MTWRERNLEDLIELHDHRRIPLSAMERGKRKGEFRYYGAQGVIDHVDAYLFDGEYVLIAEDGENLRSRKQPIAQIASGQFWVNNHAHIVSAKDGESNNFFLCSLLNWINIAPFVTGAAQPKFTQGALKALVVKVPDAVTQGRIASVLSAYDDLITTNQRRIALLEDAARRLYREWFVHLRFPGHESVPVHNGVPQGWQRLTLDDVCDAIGGGTPSTARPEYWGGDVTWITPTDVTRNDSVVLLDSEKKITAAGLSGSSAKLVPPETILMTSRASIGYFALMDREVCTNQGFISVVPKQKNSRMFLLWHLKARVEEMVGLATGATFKELSKSKFRALPALWPDEIVLEAFEKLVYPMIQQVRFIKKQNAHLTRARDLLLPKLMSGQLDVSGIALPEEVTA